MAEYVNYEIWLGTFIDDQFKWTKIEEHDELKDALEAFKKYAVDQFSYSDEMLKKVWDSGRLDVELRQGTKLLNWMGIYSRVASEIGKDDKDKEDKGEPKEKPDESPKKDSAGIIHDSADRFHEGDLVALSPELAGNKIPVIYKVLEHSADPKGEYYILDTGKRMDGSPSEIDPPFWVGEDDLVSMPCPPKGPKE